MKQPYLQPIFVKGTRAWRTYLGGKQLDARAGCPDAADSNFPEEWMFSTTRALNPGREDIVEGLCTLVGDETTTLKSLIEAFPAEILGKQHQATWGDTLGVLVKQIDSAERLTVQVHPDNPTAQKLFNSPFGKTESWHIVSTREDLQEAAHIYLGFQEGITRAAWQQAFIDRNYDAMLGMLHKIYVAPGETYLIKGGVPHAIGEGCLLVEVQEPTDYTIRVEQVTPSGQTISDQQCHQGLGFETMFDCFHFEGVSLEEAKQRWQMQPQKSGDITQIISYTDTSCFGMDTITFCGEKAFSAEETYYGLYALSGDGVVHCAQGETAIGAGAQLLISASCNDFIITAAQEITLIKIKGPRC